MKIHHSASSLNKYEHCPLLWKHRYIDDWVEPQSDGAMFGVVLHDAAAERLLHEDYTPDFFTLFKKYGIIEVDGETRVRDLVQLCEDFYDTWLKHQDFQVKPIAVEIEKEIEHEELGDIVGKIDAIYQLDTGLKIVDHKFMLNTEKHKDGLQMAIYSLLVPEAKEFVYEKIGQEDYAVQRVRSLESSLKKVRKLIDGINKEQFGATPSQWFIRYCPFLEKCGECKKGV